MVTSFLAFLVIFSVSSEVYGLSSSDLSTLDSALKKVVRGAKFPTTVRLAFHDCVGGCDGCINIDNPDNAGLEELVADLDTAYVDNNLSELLSRADFWAYAGQYALEKGMGNHNSLCDYENCTGSLALTFQTGRVDCDTAPYTDVDVHLPGPHLTYDELVAFYEEQFNFTEAETVAIMGGHSLGGMDKDNSGFKGAWVEAEAQEFNNNYYKVLVDNDEWFQMDVATRSSTVPSILWHANDTGFMLNSDMVIYKQVEMINDDGESSCTFNECAASNGAAYVEEYANDIAKWLEDFSTAFTKMQATGAFTLVDLED